MTIQTIEKINYEILIPSDEYLPALLAEKLNMAVESAELVKQVGCVYIFNVTPYRKVDPAVIVCSKADLSFYHHLWGQWAQGYYRLTGVDNLLASCDDAIEQARNSFWGSEQEGGFLTAELLKWKNEIRKVLK